MIYISGNVNGINGLQNIMKINKRALLVVLYKRIVTKENKKLEEISDQANRKISKLINGFANKFSQCIFLKLQIVFRVIILFD